MKNQGKHLQLRLQTMDYILNMQKYYEKVNAKTTTLEKQKRDNRYKLFF